MTVVGLDIGTFQTVVGVAKNRGVDILLNEFSNRTTPTILSFGPTRRYFGEMARGFETNNNYSTFKNFLRVIGRKLSDNDVLEIEGKYIDGEMLMVDDEIGFEVMYRGEKSRFSTTQLLGMYLNLLKENADKISGTSMSEVVLAVPTWFNDVQRRSVIRACQTATINCLGLLNENTAAALSYALDKLKLEGSDSQVVVFVNMGYSNFTVSIVEFSAQKLKVRSSRCAKNCGGRDLDMALFKYVKRIIKNKYKVDIEDLKKAKIRLMKECERVKKILSANQSANLVIENIIDDVDINETITREEFEEIIKKVLKHTKTPLKEVLSDAEMEVKDVDVVEAIGGTIRIPAVKNSISKFFKQAIKFSMNMEEAVARGCTLYSAILSPKYKTVDFKISDITSYGISFRSDVYKTIHSSVEPVYRPHCYFPVSKTLTFCTNRSFIVHAVYQDSGNTENDKDISILRFKVCGVEGAAKGINTPIIKVATYLTRNGTLVIGNATLCKKFNDSAIGMDGIPQISLDECELDSKNTHTDRLRRITELKVEITSQNFSNSRLLEYINTESKMLDADKNSILTENAKNNLEEYIYEIGDKLKGEYLEYVAPDQLESYQDSLSKTQKWLYTEDAAKADYSILSNKLNRLKSFGDSVVERANDHIELTTAIKSFEDQLLKWAEFLHNPPAEHRSLSKSAKKKISGILDRNSDWLKKLAQRQTGLSLYEPPVMNSRMVLRELDKMNKSIGESLKKTSSFFFYS